MADVTRGTATLGFPSTQRTVSVIHPANIDFRAHSGALAGEDLASGQPVYLAADGTYYRADANSGTAAAKKFDGMVVKDAYAGDPVTVMYDGHMGGYTGLTPGKTYFVSDSIGEIADAASGTTTLPVGKALTAGILRVYASVS